MSQKNVYIENDLNSMKYFSPDEFIPSKSYISSFNNNSPISRINNSFTEAINSKYSINNLNEFKSLNKAPLTSDDNYINERYNIVKKENAQLKKSLFELEKSYKVQKGEMEEKILVLRDENSSLQLQIQKTIEKQKNEFKNIDKIYDEKNSLMDENNILKNELNNLKDTITKQNADIEEKNKIINDLQNEKEITIEEEKMYKNKINNLMKDKNILISQMQDLNITISDKISPKLKQNENNLANLKEQIENLRINNEKLKTDNIVLFKENKIQKNLIKILTKQNKKLLEELKFIYDRDILLMNNMEKEDTIFPHLIQEPLDKIDEINYERIK
jgi:chromosome segregation ATPase